MLGWKAGRSCHFHSSWGTKEGNLSYEYRYNNSWILDLFYPILIIMPWNWTFSYKYSSSLFLWESLAVDVRSNYNYKSINTSGFFTELIQFTATQSIIKSMHNISSILHYIILYPVLHKATPKSSRGRGHFPVRVVEQATSRYCNFWRKLSRLGSCAK